MRRWSDLPVNVAVKRLGVLVGLPLAMAGCAFFNYGEIPDDGKSAKVMRLDDLRAMRYCEVFLIGDHAEATQDLKANYYNTTDLNNKANARDTCPAAIWGMIDAKALKKHGLGVFKHGPRHWAIDWIELPVGALRTFDGLDTRWMGEVPAIDWIDLPVGAPRIPFGLYARWKVPGAYAPTTVVREFRTGFAKGRPVFIVESPGGMPWVMQSYSNTVDRTLSGATRCR